MSLPIVEGLQVRGENGNYIAEYGIRAQRSPAPVDREIIEEKSRQLESLATRLAKYLSPQIYKSIFENEDGGEQKHARKNLTIFLSDIVKLLTWLTQWNLSAWLR